MGAHITPCITLHQIGLTGFPSGSVVKNPPAVQETLVPSLGWEDPLEEGMTTHSFSCLENPMNRGAWRVTVHRVVKSRTQLSK